MKSFRCVYTIESHIAVVKTVEVEDVSDAAEEFLKEIDTYLKDYGHVVSTQVEDFIPVRLMSNEDVDQQVRVLQHNEKAEWRLVLVEV